MRLRAGGGTPAADTRISHGAAAVPRPGQHKPGGETRDGVFTQHRGAPAASQGWEGPPKAQELAWHLRHRLLGRGPKSAMPMLYLLVHIRFSAPT